MVKATKVANDTMVGREVLTTTMVTMVEKGSTMVETIMTGNRVRAGPAHEIVAVTAGHRDADPAQLLLHHHAGGPPPLRLQKLRRLLSNMIQATPTSVWPRNGQRKILI